MHIKHNMRAIHMYGSNVLVSTEILRMKAIVKARNETFSKSSTAFHTIGPSLAFILACRRLGTVANSNDSKKLDLLTYSYSMCSFISIPILSCGICSNPYKLSKPYQIYNKSNWNLSYTHTNCEFPLYLRG